MKNQTPKERPALMCALMVRATLLGMKTQTRRIMNPQPSETFVPVPDNQAREYFPTRIDRKTGEAFPGGQLFGVADEFEDHPCPYGRPGERLWIRETWAKSIYCDDRKPSDMEKPGRGYGWPVWYAADGAVNTRCSNPVPQGGPGFTTKGKTRVSIHMPRWASRITLELTAVRAERLQDITAADAIAEGCPGAEFVGMIKPIKWYRELWESLNGPGSWNQNPYVWVLEFKKL